MRIICPGCESVYDVPDHLLASGPKRLRCAGCGLDFDTPAKPALPTVPVLPPSPPAAAAPSPALPASLVAPPPAIEPPPRPMPPPLSAQFSQPRLAVPSAADDEGPSVGLRVVTVLAWLLSLAVLGAGAWAGVTYRDKVMAAWPASERLYAALGMDRPAP